MIPHGKKIGAAILLVVFSLSCQKTVQRVRVHEIWRLIENGSADTYQNGKKENLLHRAVLSFDTSLIRHVDSLFPELRNQPDSNGYLPIHTAAANCPLAVIVFLDSLRFDFSELVRIRYTPGYHVTSDVVTVATERFNAEARRSFSDSTRVQDCDAEKVCAYVMSKHAQSVWPEGARPDGIFRHAKHYLHHGYSLVADAQLNYLRQHPVAIKELLSYRVGLVPQYPLDSEDISLLRRLPLPADQKHGYYFSMAIKFAQPALTQAFIDQGAVVNNMSVYNREVRSPLSAAKAQGMQSQTTILEKNGATDKNWFEILVPGFWPSIVCSYDPTMVWSVIISSKDTTFLRTGELDPSYFSIQRSDYWMSEKEHAIFMVTTNKPGGITSFETVISGPCLVTRDKPLDCKLRSGASYELSIPAIEGTVLRVISRQKHQDLLQYFSEPALDERKKTTFNGNAVGVIWAGDIDSDGELDLLLASAPDDYANFGNTFFLALSSLATKNQLLGWADEVYIFGSYREFSTHAYGREWKIEDFFPYIKQIDAM